MIRTLVPPLGWGVERSPGVLTPAPPPGRAVSVTQPDVASPGMSPDVLARPGTMGRGDPSRQDLEVARAPPPLIHLCFRPVSTSNFSGIPISPKLSTLISRIPYNSALPATLQISVLYTLPFQNTLLSHPTLVIPENPELPSSFPACLHSPIPGPSSGSHKQRPTCEPPPS